MERYKAQKWAKRSALFLFLSAVLAAPLLFVGVIISASLDAQYAGGTGALVASAMLFALFAASLACLVLGLAFRRRAKKSGWFGWGNAITLSDEEYVLFCMMSLSQESKAKAVAHKALESEQSGEARQGQAPLEPDNLSGMILHSRDFFATVKDIAGQKSLSGPAGLASRLFAKAGVEDWCDMPQTSVVRLSRTKRYWLGFPSNVKDSEKYDRVLACESALNIVEDMVSEGCGFSDAQDLEEAVLDRVLGIACLPLKPGSFAKQFEELFGVGSAQSYGDFMRRMGIAECIESANTPVRVLFDMRISADGSIVLFSVELPRPEVFCFVVGQDQSKKNALARDYAAQLALFMARCAFLSKGVERAVVVGCEHASTIPLLSLELSKGDLERLAPSLGRGFDTSGDLLSGDLLRMQYDEGLWLVPVKSHMDPCDDEDISRCYDFAVEGCASPCSEVVKGLCGASVASELGMSANMLRKQAWDEVAGSLGKSVLESVSKLTELKQSYGDAYVEDACNRLSKALVEGDVGLDDMSAQEQLFLQGDKLFEAIGASRIAAFLPKSEIGLKASAQLAAEIAPLMQINYLDDTEKVYRYFASTAERIAFNLASGGGRQRVVLVPDEYYAALRQLVYLLIGQEKLDAAKQYAEEMVRVAPASADAKITLSNVLAAQGSLFEAFDLAKEALDLAVTADTVALCHYRLAYFAWRLGKNKLAVACFRRSLELNTSLRPAVLQELTSLLRSEPGLVDMSVEECDSQLASEEVPKGLDQELVKRTLQAAAACAEDNLYPAAAQLSAAYFDMDRDDALLDVCKSYRATSQFGMD